MFNYRRPSKPMGPNERILSRDCAATVIPSGESATLPSGTKISITHRLGGNFTVLCDYGMFRVNGADHEALGEPAPAATPQTDTPAPGAKPDEKTLWDALRTVFDPEIPVNIVDLGLVYSLTLRDQPDGTSAVDMAMTLTAPGCGMGPAIAEDARQRLMSIPGISDAKVELVWDPPWNQGMISEEGKMQLGLI